MLDVAIASQQGQMFGSIGQDLDPSFKYEHRCVCNLPSHFLVIWSSYIWVSDIGNVFNCSEIDHTSKKTGISVVGDDGKVRIQNRIFLYTGIRQA